MGGFDRRTTSRRGGSESEQISELRDEPDVTPETADTKGTMSAPTGDPVFDAAARTGPSRDANIAEKGGLNDTLATAYRASGAPGGSFVDGSYLLQGQAQAGEMPAPLETGGQLGPTKAAAEGMPPMVAPEVAAAPAPRERLLAEGDGAGAAIYNQSPLAQKLFPLYADKEISDQDAANIASGIAADMAATHGGGKTY
jgi:hypothetical protein